MGTGTRSSWLTRQSLMATGLAVIAIGATVTATRQAGVADRLAPYVKLDAAQAGAPQHGSRSDSLRLARRQVALIVLPHGTQRLPQHPVPRRLRHPSQIPAIRDTVDIYRLFALPWSMNRSFCASIRPLE
jgi:hypothetical protein